MMTTWLVALLVLLAGGLVVYWVARARAAGPPDRGLTGRRGPAWTPPRLIGSDAHQRAEALLAQCLTPEAWQSLQRTGVLSVPSPGHPGRVYHIPRRAGAVVVYHHRQPVFQLCVHPREHLPDADLVLLHKLMIEGDEERYLAIANHTGVPARW
jgi:hypothetical protein